MVTRSYGWRETHSKNMKRGTTCLGMHHNSCLDVLTSACCGTPLDELMNHPSWTLRQWNLWSKENILWHAYSFPLTPCLKTYEPRQKPLMKTTVTEVGYPSSCGPYRSWGFRLTWWWCYKNWVLWPWNTWNLVISRSTAKQKQREQAASPFLRTMHQSDLGTSLSTATVELSQTDIGLISFQL